MCSWKDPTLDLSQQDIPSESEDSEEDKEEEEEEEKVNGEHTSILNVTEDGESEEEEEDEKEAEEEWVFYYDSKALCMNLLKVWFIDRPPQYSYDMVSNEVKCLHVSHYILFSSHWVSLASPSTALPPVR